MRTQTEAQIAREKKKEEAFDQKIRNLLERIIREKRTQESIKASLAELSELLGFSKEDTDLLFGQPLNLTDPQSNPRKTAKTTANKLSFLTSFLKKLEESIGEESNGTDNKSILETMESGFEEWKSSDPDRRNNSLLTFPQHLTMIREFLLLSKNTHQDVLDDRKNKTLEITIKIIEVMLDLIEPKRVSITPRITPSPEFVGTSAMQVQSGVSCLTKG